MERNSISKSNKLKLFGVELDPSQLHETDRGSTSEKEGADESISSSSPSSTVTEKLLDEKAPSGGERRSPLPPPTKEPAAKKFVCSCCFKVFANPQALGGHQNAHKNEKMRLKKLQLQAKTASCLNYYINPFSNNPCGRDGENFVNFCGSNPHHLNKEVRISFGSESDSAVNCTNYVLLRQNKHKFSITDGSRMKSRPIHGHGRSPSSPKSKRICIRKALN